MPTVTPKDFAEKSLAVIAQANRICRDYAAQGYDLTLRQLYYQFVSRGLIPNADTEYKRLGSIVNDARLARLMDWDYITDRTRNLRSLPTWNSPSEIIRGAATKYRTDLWANQPNYVEVWIEKDALVGVVQVACDPLQVPYFSCRGYTSQSEVWAAAQRLGAKVSEDRHVTILHLGDHDPSGIDMTRDITDRLNLFLDGDGHDPDQLEVRRIALNMGQVRQYNPPPNPAKLTDSRGSGYVARFGPSSWELDALDPATLSALITDNVMDLIDTELWAGDLAGMTRDRSLLGTVSRMWEQVVEHVEGEL